MYRYGIRVFVPVEWVRVLSTVLLCTGTVPVEWVPYGTEYQSDIPEHYILRTTGTSTFLLYVMIIPLSYEDNIPLCTF